MEEDDECIQINTLFILADFNVVLKEKSCSSSLNLGGFFPPKKFTTRNTLLCFSVARIIVAFMLKKTKVNLLILD